MPFSNYLTIRFSQAQLNMQPHQRSDEVKDLQQYLSCQKICGAHELEIFCSAEFYQRTDLQMRAVQGSIPQGHMPLQEMLYILRGQIFSFPDFMIEQQRAIQLLGFKVQTEERLRPSIPKLF
jgi:hypothetical protein